MKNHIVLIGMPASGKSTIGVMAAKFLGFDFIDTDILIQKAAGCTLPAIIKERGADGFLDFEGEIVRKTCPEAPTVIATGGSVIYRDAAMRHLKSIGTVIYLKLSCKNLKKRLHALEERGVVIGGNMSFEELYAERIPLYERYADVTVEEDGKDTHEILRELEAAGTVPGFSGDGSGGLQSNPL